MRGKWTDAMKRLKRFVVSMDRAGIVIPYWSRPARAPSGREGLSDARWFRAVRLRTLAAGDVAAAHEPRNHLVVGLADEPEGGRGRRATSRGPPATTSGRATRASAIPGALARWRGGARRA